MRHQIGGSYGRPGEQLDKGHDLLIARNGATDYGRLNHRLMLVQHCFDLGGTDIEARADDQLFGAADDVKDLVFEPR